MAKAILQDIVTPQGGLAHNRRVGNVVFFAHFWQWGTSDLINSVLYNLTLNTSWLSTYNVETGWHFDPTKDAIYPLPLQLSYRMYLSIMKKVGHNIMTILNLLWNKQFWVEVYRRTLLCQLKIRHLRVIYITPSWFGVNLITVCTVYPQPPTPQTPPPPPTTHPKTPKPTTNPKYRQSFVFIFFVTYESSSRWIHIIHHLPISLRIASLAHTGAIMWLPQCVPVKQPWMIGAKSVVTCIWPQQYTKNMHNSWDVVHETLFNSYISFIRPLCVISSL